MVRAYRKHPKLFISPLVNSRWIASLKRPIAWLTFSVWIGFTGSLPTMAQQMPSLKPAETNPGNTNRSTTNPSGTLPPEIRGNNPQIQQFPGQAPASSIRLEEAYTLGPGDAIQIDIFNVPEYSGANGQYEVLVDGTINMPLIGQVPVEGRTLSEITAILQLAYQPFLQHPEFLTVKLLAKRALQIGIAGEVRRPGSYTMGGTGAQVPTLAQVIQLAGGITQSADIRQIQLRRRQLGRPDQQTTLNLASLIQQGDLTQDITLRDGDTIFIPTSTTFNPFEATELASATLAGEATEPINIVVVGEVTRPGSYTVTRIDGTGGTLTVTRALQTAGGVSLSADIGEIQLIRRPKAAPPQTIAVNLWDMVERGDLTQDIILQEGDTIVVPTVSAENFDQARSIKLATANFAADTSQTLNIAVVGEVNRPGTYIVGTGAGTTADPNSGIAQGTIGLTTVTRAIQTAGGITPLADIREIEVRRQRKDGTEQLIALDLWQLLETGELSNDIILQQGDTIVVPTATNIDLAEAPQVALASFSPGAIRVNIVGEVLSPGTLELPPNTSLNQALLAAGGFNNSRAHKEEVELIRLNPNGTVNKEVVPVDFNQGLDEQTNPTLRNNDVIVVGRSGLAKTRDTLSEVGGTIGAVTSPVLSFFGFLNFFQLFGGGN